MSLAFECTTLTTFRAYRSDLLQHIQLLGEQHRSSGAGSASRCKNRRGQERNIHVRRQIELRPGADFNSYWTFSSVLSQIPFHEAAHVFGQGGAGFDFGWRRYRAALLGYSWVTGIPTVRAHGGWFSLSALLMLIGMQTLLTGGPGRDLDSRVLPCERDIWFRHPH